MLTPKREQMCGLKRRLEQWGKIWNGEDAGMEKWDWERETVMERKEDKECQHEEEGQGFEEAVA